MAESRLRAWCGGTQKWSALCVQGLSTELGAFVAGVMLSATDQQEHALSQLEHVKHFFLSLFIASTGLVMSPGFLMQHLKILAGTPASNAQQSNLPLHGFTLGTAPCDSLASIMRRQDQGRS